MSYQTDPLNERAYEKIPGVIWKYSNRVLILLTHQCPSACAFCFRAHLYDTQTPRATNEEIVQFVKQHRQIEEVIFSGGEPLILSNDITNIIGQLADCDHVKRFRIHTRLPITFPDRIDMETLTSLPHSINQPVYLTIHTNHPNEVKNEKSKVIIQELRKAGFILLSHTVFLKGINDKVETLATLFEDLVNLGVKPYYIFHCDHMQHTERFEVPVSIERSIMTELRKRVTGIAYPLHVIDSSSGKGKIPIPTNNWDCKVDFYRDFADGINQLQ